MSWLFSLALVEAYLEENSWDGEPFAQLSVMPTQHKFWRNDKTMEFSNLSRFGLTCNLLTESRGEALLTWYLEGSHARTSASLGAAQESKVSAADCGKSLPGLLAKYDRDTHSLKTAQCSLFEDLKQSSVTLPRWGTMQNGGISTLKHAEPIISAAEPSSWLPTPTAHNAKEGNYPAERTRNTPTLGACLGGKPNPQYTEWMMAWPIDWTDLKPLATDKFQLWLQQHGKC